MNFLTETQLDEAYAMTRSHVFINRNTGKAVPDHEKEFATDQCIAAFLQAAQDNPSEKPRVWEVFSRVQHNRREERYYDANGEQVYGFAILAFILMAIAEVALKKLIEWLWDKWTKKQQAITEH